jgi:predicted GH43/DUF377 family glycosyl hydrolase
MAYRGVVVKKEGGLLQKRDLDFEIMGVLNPAVIMADGVIHLFYRAVARNNYSTIGYCRLSGPLTVAERNNHPVLFPEHEYEKNGIEDPRIVRIDGRYYLSYTAYDGINALSALATSADLVDWTKRGLIAPLITVEEFQDILEKNVDLNAKYNRYNIDARKNHIEENVWIWDKNLVFFPRKINNRLFFLHRIKPDIQIVSGINDISDLTPEFWKNYFKDFDQHILLAPKHDHEISYIGAGAPPIETPIGWLLIYHTVHDTMEGYVYCCSAALLDLDDPTVELSRLPYPLFFPEEDYELTGEVNNVCFPSGTLVLEDRLFIYYGAADSSIAVASLSMSELLKELEQHYISKRLVGLDGI